MKQMYGFRMSDVGGQSSDVGGRMSEFGDQRSDIGGRMLAVECCQSDVRDQMPDVERRMLENNSPLTTPAAAQLSASS